MDVFASGLIAADKVLQNTYYKQLRKQRYSSFDQGDGARLNSEAFPWWTSAKLQKTRESQLR